MDQKNLRIIFNAYIENFEKFNNDEHREYMKWEFAKAFSEFDFNTPNLSSELKRLKKISSVLIDGSRTYPFGAMVTYSEKEPETVRGIFGDLFAADNGDFKLRQEKINTFINHTEALRQKYNLGPLSKNDLRSAMAFLFFRDPDNHDLYKSTQAGAFAEAVGYYGEWGAMSNFKMEVFYKMCDWLVEEIKKYPPLLETNASRYELFEGLHPDKNYHILAFDIIYTSQVYRFYNLVEKKPMDPTSRKLHNERVRMAQEFSEKLKESEEAMNTLKEAEQFISENYGVNARVMHKVWKIGTIESIKSGIAVIDFESLPDRKSLDILLSIKNGIIIHSDRDIAEQTKALIPILKMENRIKREYSVALDGYSKYSTYLD